MFVTIGSHLLFPHCLFPSFLLVPSRSHFVSFVSPITIARLITANPLLRRPGNTPLNGLTRYVRAPKGMGF